MAHFDSIVTITYYSGRSKTPLYGENNVIATYCAVIQAKKTVA